VDADFAVFCRREHPRLVAALDLMCGSFAVAEDLAQEALARVCKDWERIRGLPAPGAYAHRIALNLAFSSYRRRAAERRAQARLAAQPRAAVEDDPTTSVAVRAALQSLRPEQRAVLVSRYFLDHSLDETAALLQMPVGTVKTHAHRGLAALRDALGEPVTAEDVVMRRA